MPTIDTITEAVRVVAPNYDVYKVVLFGSYAKGTNNSSSDIDIMLDTGQRFSLFDAARMRPELSGKLNAKVDVVSRSALYEPIAKNILNSQVLLYER